MSTRLLNQLGAHGLSRLAIPTNPKDLIPYAFVMDREADSDLSEGRPAQAERKANLAEEARRRALGDRA